MTMPNYAQACVKTPATSNPSKNRHPHFRYGAFFFAARDRTTCFSLFQNSIWEFSHRLALQRTAAGRRGWWSRSRYERAASQREAAHLLPSLSLSPSSGVRGHSQFLTQRRQVAKAQGER